MTPSAPATLPPSTRPRPGSGLLRPCTILLPTWRGWLLLCAILGALGYVALREGYAFLAASDPQPGDILVVEGWSAEYGLKVAQREFESGNYGEIFVTGGPIDKASPLAAYKTCADYDAIMLVRMGLDESKVHAVPSDAVRQDRTYASALSLKAWLREHGRTVEKVNLVSIGAHSRRSRLLFEKAFGDGVKVGVIAVPDREFELARWWTSSAGVRSVTSEWFAYLYARLLFHPGTS